jgi:uncharacterized membrane protein AbrB (regulator of aidB expression)
LILFSSAPNLCFSVPPFSLHFIYVFSMLMIGCWLKHGSSQCDRAAFCQYFIFKR